MQTVPLNESQPVKLDGSGNGTVKLGPRSHGETWHPEVASVKVSTATAEAACKIYLGHTATDDNFLDGTFSGSSGDSTDRVSGNPLWLGNYIFAVWSGGDAGATATLSVIGTREIP